MKVTIITATYNSSATVKDTLRSIAQQSYENIEHLIVDGLSSDETLDIVSQFDHVSLVSSEKDQGIYDAMNRGISMATGDVIGILNSDDFYSNSNVIDWVAKVFKDKNVDAIYGDLVYFKQDDEKKILRTWKSGEYSRDKFLKGWMPPHPTFFVRKEVYKNFGKFRLDMGSAADYEFMLRVLYKEKCSVEYIPKTLVNMRDGGESNATILNRIKANRMDRKAWKVNGLKPKFYTLSMKPIRKITQFIKK